MRALTAGVYGSTRSISTGTTEAVPREASARPSRSPAADCALPLTDNRAVIT